MRSQLPSPTTGSNSSSTVTTSSNSSTLLTSTSTTSTTTVNNCDETAKAIVKISSQSIETLQKLTNALNETIRDQEDQKIVSTCKYRRKVLNWLKSGFDTDTQRIQGDKLPFPNDISADQLIEGLNWLGITNDWHVWKRALTIYYDKHNECSYKDPSIRCIIARNIIPHYMWSPAQKKIIRDIFRSIIKKHDDRTIKDEWRECVDHIESFMDANPDKNYRDLYNYENLKRHNLLFDFINCNDSDPNSTQLTVEIILKIHQKYLARLTYALSLDPSTGLNPINTTSFIDKLLIRDIHFTQHYFKMIRIDNRNFKVKHFWKRLCAFSDTTINNRNVIKNIAGNFDRSVFFMILKRQNDYRQKHEHPWRDNDNYHEFLVTNSLMINTLNDLSFAKTLVKTCMYSYLNLIALKNNSELIQYLILEYGVAAMKIIANEDKGDQYRQFIFETVKQGLQDKITRMPILWFLPTYENQLIRQDKSVIRELVQKDGENLKITKFIYNHVNKDNDYFCFLVDLILTSTKNTDKMIHHVFYKNTEECQFLNNDKKQVERLIHKSPYIVRFLNQANQTKERTTTCLKFAIERINLANLRELKKQRNGVYVQLINSLLPTSNAERKVMYSYLKQCTFLLSCINHSLLDNASFIHSLLVQYQQFDPKKILSEEDHSARQALLTTIHPQGQTTLANPKITWGQKSHLKACSVQHNMQTLWDQLKDKSYSKKRKRSSKKSSIIRNKNKVIMPKTHQP
jgi:hypothetical protein